MIMTKNEHTGGTEEVSCRKTSDFESKKDKQMSISAASAEAHAAKLVHCNLAVLNLPQSVMGRQVRVARSPAVRLQASSFRFHASGFRLQASGFRLQASGFRLQASGFILHRREREGPSDWQYHKVAKFGLCACVYAHVNV
jgi:hypothetical protein